MNCACNRYVSCTECRNAYKDSVKRELRLAGIIKELERRDCESMGGDYNVKISCREAISMLRGIDKNEIR
jgi:hypothetical protein